MIDIHIRHPKLGHTTDFFESGPRADSGAGRGSVAISIIPEGHSILQSSIEVPISIKECQADHGSVERRGIIVPPVAIVPLDVNGLPSGFPIIRVVVKRLDRVSDRCRQRTGRVNGVEGFAEGILGATGLKKCLAHQSWPKLCCLKGFSRDRDSGVVEPEFRRQLGHSRTNQPISFRGELSRKVIPRVRIALPVACVGRDETFVHELPSLSVRDPYPMIHVEFPNRHNARIIELQCVFVPHEP